MSRHKPPKNTALKDALKAAVKSSSSDVDDANSPPAASSGTNIFRSLFEPDRNFKVHSAKPRVRKERRKVRRKKKVRRLQGGPTQPSYAAIRSAYGGNIKAPPVPSNKGLEAEPDSDQPFHLSSALVHKSVATTEVNWLYQGSSRTQFGTNDALGCIDVVMGIDFGTTFTKVVLREPGSRRSWAVPFTDSANNPYLLQGGISLEQGAYRPRINNDLSLGSLKLPILEGAVSEEHFSGTAAYLAFVIAHSRRWFLETRRAEFARFEIDWSYHMGIPASSYANATLVQSFEDLLHAALKLSAAIDENDCSVISSVEARRIVKTIATSEPYEDTVDDCVELAVYPEIAAQLHGHVASDRWDSDRRKFVLVDVGSGTVDATMVNVTQFEDQWSYVFLKTMVTLNGTLMLHRHRLEKLQQITPQYPNGGESARNIIKAGSVGLGSWRYVPDRIAEYLESPFDEAVINNFDHRFRLDYQGRVTDLLIQAKKRDPRHSHRDLPIILCGGGSRNTVYSEYLSSNLSQISVSFRPIPMSAPSGLDMSSASPDEFHRLSVAYGLAFEELSKVIGEEAFDDADIEIATAKKARFVSKDDV